MKRTIVFVILVLAFCGLADSMYLAQHEASGTPLICNAQGLSECNTVVSSQYSRVFGIPLAEYGVFFYAVLFVIVAVELVFVNTFLRRVIQGLALVALATSLYSTFTQVFLIEALCIYCLASAIISTLIFILATRIEPLKRPSLAFIRGVRSTEKRIPMPPAS